MKFFYSLLNLPPTNLLAFALVIPTYITFFLCFATRHLTLNLMNVLLYMVILKATLPSNPKKRSKRKINQEGH